MADIDGCVYVPYSPRAMFGRFAPIFCLLAIVLLRLGLVWAEEPPISTSEQALPVRQLLVLRSGEVLWGEVHRQDDRYTVIGNDSEVALPVRDVDFLCNSLDEAYRVQQARMTAGSIDDHLNLAEWCLRHDLVGYAAGEIGKAMEIDPQNRRLVLLDRRLQLSVEESARAKAVPASQSKSALPATAEELDRMVRCLPAGTAETFTATIQPMLLNYCATAGCHGPNGSSKYTLLKPALGKQPLVRVTQRNLYNTLQWLDHEKPEDSKLLKAATEPHAVGGATATATLDLMKVQELIAWVLQVGQGAKAAPFGTAPVLAAGQTPSKSRSVLATPYSPPGSIGSAVMPAARMSAKTVISQSARIVPSSRANAPAAKISRAPPVAAPITQVAPLNQAPPLSPQAGTPAPTVPERQIPRPPSRSGDEIPNANEVLP